MPSTNDGRFAGKVAFITGGGNGIGRATAVAFASEGAKIVAVDMAEPSLADTAEQVRAKGGEIVTVVADVTSSDDVQAAVAAAVDAFGGIDVAFNNAGIEQDQIPLLEVADDVFDQIIATDLRGVFLSMKHEIPVMQRAGGGVIINTSSSAGVKGIPKQGTYVAAKHAIVGLTRSTALEYLDDGIRINAVAPGLIDTDMTDRLTGGTEQGRKEVLTQEPIGRMGTADEVAAAVLWLAAPESAFTVGHVLVIDGGQTL